MSASPEKGLRQVIGQDVPAGTYRISSATAQEWPIPLRIRPDFHVNPLQDYSIWKVTQLQYVPSIDLPEVTGPSILILEYYITHQLWNHAGIIH